MADEPSLPRLPAVSWDEQTQSFSNNPRKRGRTPRQLSAGNNSSDPAIFSSDDDPALDNYVEGRKKKRYVGSWFQQQPASSDPVIDTSKGKRKLTREFDSGVFLGSDDTDEGFESDIPPAFQIPARPKIPQLESASTSVSEAERSLQAKIRDSLDNGTETIDFWNMDLDWMSNETLQPLSQFECIPQVIKGVAFEQRDPSLQLILAKNRLNRLPGALFDVTQLTTLSLRNNKLTEIPPAIRKLQNLQELNLSYNRLRHLPVEILDLLNADSKLQKFHIYPNPFLQPDQGDEIFEILDDGEGTFHTEHDLDMEPGPEEDLEGWMPPEVPEGTQPRMLTRRLARSPIQVADSFGRVKQGTFRLPDASVAGPIEVEAIYKKRMTSHGEPLHWTESKDSGSRGESMVPSLMETVMRSCHKSVHLPQFKGLLPEDFAGIRQLFDRAVEQKEIGSLSCSRCRRTIVVPTLTWIEWREINTMTPFRRIPSRYLLESLSEAEDELVVPFLHLACSWRCGPGEEHSGWEFPKGCEGMTEGYVYQGLRSLRTT